MIKYKIMQKSFAALALFFASFALVSAVSTSDFYDWSVQFTPDTPGPNTTVSATVVSYSFDANRASINWILNGANKLKGTGQKDFSFSTGNLGTQTSLTVSITTDAGVQLSKSFSFKPADVDILWQAQNYAPPTYRGKILPASDSLIRVTAIPYFPESASKLVYDWQIDFKNNPDVSGMGKNSFTFTSADLNANTISLTVSNYDQSIVAKKSVDIDIGAPKIIFYEDNPLEGTKYNRALANDIQLTQDNLILKAEPYFFSLNNLAQLSYDWLMNGNKIVPDQFPNILSLKKGDAPGRSLIELKVNNPVNILQFGDNSLGINY